MRREMRLNARVLALCCTAWLFSAILPDMALAGNCMEVALLHSPYRCDLTGADSAHASFCMGVVTFSSSPHTFFLEFPASGQLANCGCEAKGSFAAPRFDDAMSFLCRGENPDSSTFALAGQVSGSRITKGQVYSPGDGNRLVFQCKPDPTC